MFVYTREAHPIDGDRPAGNRDVEQPVTLVERRTVAKQFLEDFKVGFPSLVDSIDDKTSTDYASLPDRMYLVGKDGKIFWAGERGPTGFLPEKLKEAIIKELE